MLSEQRYDVILKLLDEKKSITVAEVKELLDTSESTVRRDITALHNAGRLERCSAALWFWTEIIHHMSRQ